MFKFYYYGLIDDFTDYRLNNI